jgi:hypothetical protein
LKSNDRRYTMAGTISILPGYRNKRLGMSRAIWQRTGQTDERTACLR